MDVEKKLSELDSKKRNLSECDLIHQNELKTMAYLQQEINDIEEISTKNKEDLIELKSETRTINEKIINIQEDVEKLKWFKLETIRRFILIIIGSVVAIFIPYLISILNPFLIQFIKSLLEGVL